MILAVLRGFLMDWRTSGDTATASRPASRRWCGRWSGRRPRPDRTRIGESTVDRCEPRGSLLGSAASIRPEVDMRMSVQREKVRFVSGGTECAAWHYPGTNGACVIMAGGFAVTKEPGTDRFAERFHEAGFAVLAFDYRRLGESGGAAAPGRCASATSSPTGRPRSRSPRRLPGVDPARIAIWGFSRPAATSSASRPRNPQLAAAIAQTPNADGPAAPRNAARYQKPCAMLRFTGRGSLDALGGLVGRPPRLVPLVGPPGTVAVLTTPDAVSDGDRALNPGNRYPDWQQAVAARSALRARLLPARPRRVRGCGARCWSSSCDQDQTALAEPAVRAAQPRARAASWSGCPAAHYAPFLDATRAGRRGRTVLPAPAPARRRAARPAARRVAECDGDDEIELSAGTIEYDGHRRRRPGARAAARAADGRLAVGRTWSPSWPPTTAAWRRRCRWARTGTRCAPDADLSLPGIARLVAEFLDRLDLHDVTLVGNDTGGALVQLLMRRRRRARRPGRAGLLRRVRQLPARADRQDAGAGRQAAAGAVRAVHAADAAAAGAAAADRVRVADQARRRRHRALAAAGPDASRRSAATPCGCCGRSRPTPACWSTRPSGCRASTGRRWWSGPARTG